MGVIKHGMFNITYQFILKFVDTRWVVNDRTTNNKFWKLFYGIYDLFWQKNWPKVFISTVFSFYVPLNPETACLQRQSPEKGGLPQERSMVCCRFSVRRGHGDPLHASAATQATHPTPHLQPWLLCGQITLFKRARIVEKSKTCVEISCQSWCRVVKWILGFLVSEDNLTLQALVYALFEMMFLKITRIHR